MYKWRCRHQNCNEYILTDNLRKHLTEKLKITHEHGKGMNLARHYISNSVKIKAVDDISTPHDLVCAWKVIYEEKNRQYPVLPRSIAEVNKVLTNKAVQTEEKENMLLVNDPVTNAIIFVLKKNLEFLCSVWKIFEFWRLDCVKIDVKKL